MRALQNLTVEKGRKVVNKAAKWSPQFLWESMLNGYVSTLLEVIVIHCNDDDDDICANSPRLFQSLLQMPSETPSRVYGWPNLPEQSQLDLFSTKISVLNYWYIFSKILIIQLLMCTKRYTDSPLYDYYIKRQSDWPGWAFNQFKPLADTPAYFEGNFTWGERLK